MYITSGERKIYLLMLTDDTLQESEINFKTGFTTHPRHLKACVEIINRRNARLAELLSEEYDILSTVNLADFTVIDSVWTSDLHAKIMVPLNFEQSDYENYYHVSTYDSQREIAAFNTASAADDIVHTACEIAQLSMKV